MQVGEFLRAAVERVEEDYNGWHGHDCNYLYTCGMFNGLWVNTMEECRA